EHHRRPVHREELVVEVGIDQPALRAGELEAHEGRLDTAEQEEDEGGDDVALADRFVVGAGEPSPEAVVPFPDALERLALPRRVQLLRQLLFGSRHTRLLTAGSRGRRAGRAGRPGPGGWAAS